jgi:nicotinamide phosphoribosyltransferase
MNWDNILLLTDSYKASHFLQLPPGATRLSSYIEARGGHFKYTVFFGLQIFCRRYLTKPFTQDDIEEAALFWQEHGEPFNREGWEYILKEHGGYLPVEIKAVPEGTVVSIKNVLAQIVNTDPKVPWLTSFLETALLRAIWYPTTVATGSRACKEIIRHYLELTAEDPEAKLPFMLHDFGARGVSSSESAGLGGAAHLVNFSGSDTVEGVLTARRFYGAAMAGFSIPAAEHSTITSWGKLRESLAYENMIKQFSKPGSFFAVVSDSYDFEHAVKEIWGKELRDKVVAAGGTLVVRPDSGDPTIVPIWAIEQLAETYGWTMNAKGYKVLKNVRVIQGDGINARNIATILGNLVIKGFSAENIVFGMGGKLLQADIDRDTQEWAMKCSAIEIDGVWVDVFKEPKGSPGKKSKRGRLALVKTADGTGFETVRLEGNEDRDVLVSVYKNGRMMQEYTWSEVKANAA